MTEQLLTVERVAELTGLSRRSVYRDVDAGELDAYRLRGRVRIPEAAPSELRRILLFEPSANRREG